jgi:hypothetical protein
MTSRISVMFNNIDGRILDVFDSVESEIPTSCALPRFIGRFRSFASRTMLSESLTSATSTRHREIHDDRLTTST